MLFIAAAAAAVILLPSHASVIGSTPTEGDVIVEQPGTFSVAMNEEILAVEGASGTNVMQLTDATGLFYGDGCSTVDGDTITLDAELGTAGDYTLTYQLVSADGHTVDGTVEFAFEPAPSVETAAGSEAAPVCGASTPASAEPVPAETAGSTPSSEPQPSASAEAGAAGEPTEGSNVPLLIGGGVAALAVAAGLAFALNRRSNRRTGEADPS
ncbi:copper resistance CopC family protein [Agrococcus sp. 1P02AA]|uniref:copper resistance CopC family protein n=1 Tax=Agrococcus sp. 1P02AA TaxID=3132259 RepID=UPI0039A73EC1